MKSPFISIFIFATIGIVIYSFYKKKKTEQHTNPFLSNRKNKDEVWKTIKQFLKDNDETGKEIVNSYVIKKNHVDFIDPNWSFLDKKNKTFEIKIRKWQRKWMNKKLSSLSKNQINPPPSQNLFIVFFQLKNLKTKCLETPRCFECEVVSTQVSKNNYDRKIIINGELNYDVEMEWVAPIKDIEDERSRIANEQIKKRAEAKKRHEQKKKLKAKKKVEKNEK